MMGKLRVDLGVAEIDECLAVGLIIEIPEPIRSQLQDWRVYFGDENIKGIPPHVTLVTGANPASWNDTVKHVRHVASTSTVFTVKLDGSETFRPVTDVVYVKVGHGFDKIVGLYEKLQSGPLDQVSNYPFHPHVTIAHEVPTDVLDDAQEKLAGFNAEFEATTIGLYRLNPDGTWLLKEELELGRAKETSAADR